MRPVLVLILLLTGTPGFAAATDARSLLDQTRRLNLTTRKWSDRVQRVKLRIIDRRGGERHRDLRMSFKKYAEDRNRSTVFFESPPDVKGVGFLQWADPHAKDVQWLYLPELKRVRQISAGAKHESFMGTDFSYDDLAIVDQITDWSERDARATLLRDEVHDGSACHVIELVPAGKDLTYGRILLWLTSGNLIVTRIEMYDKRDQLEKRLTLSSIRDIGAVPTAFDMEMRNEQTGSRTAVHFDEVRYDVGLGDEMFTQRALEQAR